MNKYNLNNLPKEAGASILQWIEAFEETQGPALQMIDRKAKRYVEQKKRLEATPANAPAKKFIEAELRELKEDITALHNTHKAALAQIESMCISHYLEYKGVVDFLNGEIEQWAQSYEYMSSMAIKLVEEKAELKKTNYPNRLKAAA